MSSLLDDRRLLRLMAIGLTVFTVKPAATRSFQNDPPLPVFAAGAVMKASDSDTELTRLLKERHNAALREISSRYKEFDAGRGTLDSMIGSSLRLLKSRLEFAANPENRKKVLEEHLEFAKELEKTARVRFQNGRIAAKELEYCRYNRLDSEIELLRHNQGVAGK